MTDLHQLAPDTVRVVFPRTTGGVYTKDVTLASLSLPEYNNISGFSGVKMFRSDALAGGAATPTNQTELDNLATQIATDYYRWLTVGQESIIYPGVADWTPEGTINHIQINTNEILSTEIHRTPVLFHDREDLFHHGASGSVDNSECCTYVANTTIIWVNNDVDIHNGTFTFNTDVTLEFYTHAYWYYYWYYVPYSGYSWSSQQDDVVLQNNPWWRVSLTGAVDLTGIAAGLDGASIRITNLSNTFDLTLKHADANSAAANRFCCPGGNDFVLSYYETVELIYDATLSVWLVVQVEKASGGGGGGITDLNGETGSTQTFASTDGSISISSSSNIHDFEFDFTGLTNEVTSPASNDRFLIYDFSDSGNEYITYTNLENSITTAVGDVDKASVSSNDTTPDYLINKIAAGDGISVTETNDGGDEDATVALDTPNLAAAPSTPAGSDLFLLYDASATSTKKLTYSNLEASIERAAATQAQQETGTATDVMVTPGRQQYHESACKGWVNFNGTGVVAIRDSYNVSSITDNGVGDYTINWTTSFSNGNYAFVATNGAGVTFNQAAPPFGTGSLRILTQTLGGVNADTGYCGLAAYGDQ